MLTWLKRLHQLYSVSLPGLSLSAVVVLDFPSLQTIDSAWWLGVLMLGLIPLACYLSFSTEVVPFPKQLPAALLTVFFIPVELVAATLWDHVSLWNVFIIQMGTELLGVMGLIAVLVIIKQMGSDRNWFLAGILLVGCLTAVIFGLIFVLPALPIGWFSYVGSATAITVIAIRYYFYLKSNERNSIESSTKFIITGLLITAILPSIVWVL